MAFMAAGNPAYTHAISATEDLRGVFFYLYMVMDVWSRKIVVIPGRC